MLSLLLLHANKAAVYECKVIPAGMMTTFHTVRNFPISKGKPKGLRRVPAALGKPVYGAFTFGPNGGQQYFYVLDMAATNGPQLYVDVNHNGDLTDDPQLKMQHAIYDSQGKPDLTSDARFLVDVPYGNRQIKLGVQFGATTKYVDKSDQPMALAVDFGAWTELRIGGKLRNAWLKDGTATGDFTAKEHEGRFRPARNRPERKRTYR